MTLYCTVYGTTKRMCRHATNSKPGQVFELRPAKWKWNFGLYHWAAFHLILFLYCKDYICLDSSLRSSLTHHCNHCYIWKGSGLSSFLPLSITTICSKPYKIKLVSCSQISLHCHHGLLSFTLSSSLQKRL